MTENGMNYNFVIWFCKYLYSVCWIYLYIYALIFNIQWNKFNLFVISHDPDVSLNKEPCNRTVYIIG